MIQYSSNRFLIEFRIKGEEVEITAVDNTYDSTIDIGVILEYSYTAKSIQLHITPGLPFEIEYIGYDQNKQETWTYTEQHVGAKYTNNTSLTQHYIIYPYKENFSQITLTPSETWNDGIKGNIDIPCYIDGEWNSFYPDKVDVTLGRTTSFYTSAVNIDEEVIVEIPPYTSVRDIVSVTYVYLNAGYVGLLKMPNSGLLFETQGFLLLQQPIDYKIELLRQ